MNYGSVLAYYDLVIYVMGLCLFIPCWCMLVMLYNVYMTQLVSFSLPSEDSVLEFVWTLIPTIMVVVLCFLNLCYLSNANVFSFSEPVKVVSHQWYWSYELVSGGVYDSFMSDFINGVSKPLRLVNNVPYSLLVSSVDVIHSFSLPDLGLKVDAIPGRLNCLAFKADRYGIFNGYCTELCGAGHSFMPIVVEVVN
uniref:Cytochrome c oxidase subunit 2 n=1 Tax=Schistosoma turkestanicum TaxID=1163369 RepID=G4WCP8_9TREM|nr:cytochrome c oxidase subunit 2 [Schistosoma turkestanicum]